MSQVIKKVLAIDPGTREMGFALLENGKPIYYGISGAQGFPNPG